MRHREIVETPSPTIMVKKSKASVDVVIDDGIGRKISVELTRNQAHKISRVITAMLMAD